MFGRGAPRCPRCGKMVYSAEEVLGAGRKWHIACFRCKTCGDRLDSTSLCTQNEEIFCKTCYGKAFGPKGYGFGGGAGVLHNTGIQDQKSEKKSSTKASVSNRPKFCTECGTKCNSTTKFCPECGNKLASPAPTSSSSISSVSSISKPKSKPKPKLKSDPAPLSASNRNPFGKKKKKKKGFRFGASQSDKCGLCSKTVYAAEKVIGAGKVWHQQCFKCSQCRDRLASNTVAENDGTLYCTTCYAKGFGPKGFGYSGGSGTTMSYTQ